MALSLETIKACRELVAMKRDYWLEGLGQARGKAAQDRMAFNLARWEPRLAELDAEIAEREKEGAQC